MSQQQEFVWKQQNFELCQKNQYSHLPFTFSASFRRGWTPGILSEDSSDVPIFFPLDWRTLQTNFLGVENANFRVCLRVISGIFSLSFD